ncbi:MULTISPECIES: transcription antitermination factor NusB [Halobacteriovorax]|uniref:Transcription antitermination factor NusB n=1 Tax=Halobacteriovorax vibrionivorans TaxID=2152716 RepID=A0ABY0IH82_9BACT|nr:MULTISPECIES: transcription antitermination factor NusB [Halobacteriovorax]AYF43483.1 transcription antitermination factor NusB [Halobacteriovorax sp. BALOs_7]RZF21945.1 transcription antitermination factor NusB [Halobacteriovorax vibrionivorans]TGD47213.1 transcription antitermination factor NusB [Halobacteriovorax sp. Y22]
MKNQAFNNKSAARSFAFKFIYKLFLKDFKNDLSDYQSDLEKLKVDIEEFEESYIKEDDEHSDNELNPSVQNYGNKLITGVIKNFESIKSTASECILKRSFDSVDAIERAIICLGIYEIKFEETPNNVAINEYVNLVKSYGKEDSKNFVNGLLDRVSKS